jgi:hypothetical protein
MKQRTKQTKNRRRARSMSPIEREIAEVHARAHQAGIRIEGDLRTSFLPQARCTPDQRARAQQLADEKGISLSEHIVRRAVSRDDGALVVE